MKSLYIILVILIISIKGLTAQSDIPELGAEVFIEPGQTTEDVRNWIVELSKAKMPFARVFIMWNYIEQTPGNWNFELYDTLFAAAERYKVKVSATLVPNQPPFFFGTDFFYYTHDMKMYSTKEIRSQAREYIKRVVERFKNSKALDSWWLYNEPNGYPIVNNLSLKGFQKWLFNEYKSIDSLNDAWQSSFHSFGEITYDERWIKGGWIWHRPYYDWNRFGREFINDQIRWLRREVIHYDSSHPFTTNPPDLFNSLSHYDVRGMNKEVNILGASIHPSWLFSWIPKNRYGLAISWINNLLRRSTQGKQYWVSELQGGANWHGFLPQNPTPNDISKWVWTSIGEGANKVIFWLLNSRMAGNEATEWSLLNFNNEPSKRMKEAIRIAETIDKNKALFSHARPLTSRISILISPNTLLMQERKYTGSNQQVSAVSPLAHQKEAMGFFKALMEIGLSPNIELIDNYEWDSKERGRIVILPDLSALSRKEIKHIERFIKEGNNLFITGRSALYDLNERSWVINNDFPLKRILGGTLVDLLSDSIKFKISIGSHKLPAQLIYGKINLGNGKIISRHHGDLIAISSDRGVGNSLWISSLIGIGAWDYDTQPLSALLEEYSIIKNIKQPFRFVSYYQNCYMKVLKSGNDYVTIVVNESNINMDIQVTNPLYLKGEILYASEGNKIANDLLVMKPNSTSITWWH